MKLWHVAAGVTGAATGTYILGRRRSKNESLLKKTGKIVAVAVLGRNVLMNLAGRLAKQTAMLQVCRGRLALTKRGGIHGIVRNLRQNFTAAS